jgi:hypothetical protein
LVIFQFKRLKSRLYRRTNYILGKIEDKTNPLGDRVSAVAGLSLDKLGDAVKKLLKNFRRK